MNSTSAVCVVEETCKLSQEMYISADYEVKEETGQVVHIEMYRFQDRLTTFSDGELVTR